MLCDSAMKYLLALHLCISFACTLWGQEVKFRFDFENADQTLKLLQSENLDSAELSTLMRLPTTAFLLRKLQIDSSTMVSALKKAKAGEEANDEEARLQYGQVVDELDSLTVYIADVKHRSQDFQQQLSATLGSYFPGGSTSEITIYPMLGGWATGYVFGDEADKFFVSLQKLSLDQIVFYAIAEHELFHVVQRANYNLSPYFEHLDSLGLGEDAAVLANLYNLWLEGSATYMSRPDKYEGTPGIQAQFAPLLRNYQRIGLSYFVVDRLTTDIYNLPEDKLRLADAALFSPSFDEVGYFVGWQMLRALLRDKTEDEKSNLIKYYLSVSPTYFVLDYIKFAKDSTYDYYKFSASFEKAVVRLHEMVIQWDANR